jgi:hypothetical protein
MSKVDPRIQAAVRYYWLTRNTQISAQAARGIIDQGFRGSVTGGRQLDGFVNLVYEILLEEGIAEQEIYYKRNVELPGYFRAEKQWDLLVVADGALVAALEFKSQASSFGNNINNRTEEALGSATDLWTAYRERLIPLTPRPWVGYLALIADCPRSTVPVKVREPHFSVSPEFVDASYIERYAILLEKLMREGLYTATCLITSPENSLDGNYSEPVVDLSFFHFEASLRSHISVFQEIRSRLDST